MSKLVPSLLGAVAIAITSGCAHAHPASTTKTTYVKANTGGWHFNANRCPDLVEDRLDRREDRRDSRVITGVRDLREDYRDRAENRRDEAVIRCPASAWVWSGPRYNKAIHAQRPANAVIYYNPTKAQYYRRAGGRTFVIKL